MFHRKLPFPAPLGAEHYLLSLTLKRLVLRCLCFAWPEHKLLTPSAGTASAAAPAQLSEAATRATSST